jgi:predicted transcriptional regulator
VKNVTFSADEEVIELARAEARARKTTLNALFRDWLDDIAQREHRREQVDAVFEEMAEYDAGGTFTREEMNER